MKRSDINGLIRQAKAFFRQHCFEMPPFAHWTPEDWKTVGSEADEIRKCRLGWDLTDFGSGDFHKIGLLLFTIRNGHVDHKEDGKSYAEKIMIVEPEQVTTGVIMLLAMAWSTQGDQFGTIFEAINKIPMVFAPAVTTVFVFGVLWKRGTNQAAMATFAVGCSIGIVYFILDLPSVGRNLAGCTQEGFQGLVTDPYCGLGVPFMLAGPMLCGLCVLVYVIVSLCTSPPKPEVVDQVCWDHPLAFLRGKIQGLSDPRVITCILLGTLAALYLLNRCISS